MNQKRKCRKKKSKFGNKLNATDKSCAKYDNKVSDFITKTKNEPLKQKSDKKTKDFKELDGEINLFKELIEFIDQIVDRTRHATGFELADEIESFYTTLSDRNDDTQMKNALQKISLIGLRIKEIGDNLISGDKSLEVIMELIENTKTYLFQEKTKRTLKFWELYYGGLQNKS